MKVVALASVRGAPGVTTTAHLLTAGIAGAVLVEADLAGSVMAIRYGLGREPGLASLAADSPPEPDGWRAHAQDAGGVPVLVGPDAPETSASLWRSAGTRLDAILERGEATLAVADVGRVSPTSPLVASSQLLVVLVRPVAEHLVALAHRLPALQDAVGSDHVVIVLAGNGPYGVADVASQLDIRVICELPDDRPAADWLISGGASSARLARSRLARATASLGTTIAALVAQADRAPAGAP